MMTATCTHDEASSPEANPVTFPWTAPTAPVLTTAATQRLIASLPENIFQLVVREAYRFRAGRLILQAMNEALSRHDLLAARRPPFFGFRRPGTKEAFVASLNLTDHEFSLWADAAKHNAEAMSRLRTAPRDPSNNGCVKTTPIFTPASFQNRWSPTGTVARLVWIRSWTISPAPLETRVSRSFRPAQIPAPPSSSRTPAARRSSVRATWVQR
ncbi:MAG: hypothetical protein EXS32_00940 [Opitutus sp.]|nr:hypothetical protein [Opitutus sp.]